MIFFGSFEVKLCIQINQSVTSNITIKDFVKDRKKITHNI